MDQPHLSTIPDNWETTRLEEVATIIMGQSPPGEHVVDWEGDFSNIGLPFIQGNAEFGNRYPNPNKWCTEPLKVAKPQDILISVRAPVGELNLTNQPICIGRGLAAIRFTSIDTSFGWHAINLTRYWLKRLSQGSTFEAIGRTEIKSLPIPVPPLQEQQKIAAVLNSIDEVVEVLAQIIDTTQNLKASMLDSLLTGTIRVIRS